MRDLGATVTRVVAVGGGTADPHLLGLVSDACGLDQVVPAATIGAARGDAFLAGRVAGLLTPGDLADWVATADTIRARPAARAEHDRRYELFRRLYGETASTVHELPGRPR